MKRRKLLLLLLCALLLAGCGGEKTPPVPETTQAPTAGASDTVAEEPPVHPGYQAILDRYTMAIAEGWGGQELVDNGMNLLLVEAGLADPHREFGYAIADLDGDGTVELVIGTITAEEFYGKMILDLYTLDGQGEPLLVFQSQARDRIYYAGDNRFASLGSGSWDSSFVTTVKLEDGELVDMTYTTDPADYVQLELTPFG